MILPTVAPVRECLAHAASQFPVTGTVLGLLLELCQGRSQGALDGGVESPRLLLSVVVLILSTSRV